MIASRHITQAAAEAGVNSQTLRYYERRGLLRPVKSQGNGYRQYSVDDVRVLRFIRRAQTLGFSLDEIQEMLRLRRTPAARREGARRVAERHLGELTRKIRELRRMERALRHLVGACHAGTDAHCPIIEAFDTSEEK
jgi:DNA-binding transcriptional MerR regulator